MKWLERTLPLLSRRWQVLPWGSKVEKTLLRLLLRESGPLAPKVLTAGTVPNRNPNRNRMPSDYD
jgi:hypothetical protein